MERSSHQKAVARTVSQASDGCARQFRGIPPGPLCLSLRLRKANDGLRTTGVGFQIGNRQGWLKAGCGGPARPCTYRRIEGSVNPRRLLVESGSTAGSDNQETKCSRRRDGSSPVLKRPEEGLRRGREQSLTKRPAKPANEDMERRPRRGAGRQPGLLHKEPFPTTLTHRFDLPYER